ncbi:MAG: hypothetical protein ACJ8EE_12295, partial [Bradyrhizobium sp.]
MMMSKDVSAMVIRSFSSCNRIDCSFPSLRGALAPKQSSLPVVHWIAAWILSLGGALRRPVGSQ